MASLLPLLLFLLVIPARAGGDVYLHDHQSPLPDLATSAATSSQLRQACKATRYPNVCNSTLSQSRSLPPNPSTADLILATGNASAAGVRTARSMIQSILNASEKASNLNRTNAARNCLEFLSYSNRRLSTAFNSALPAGALADAPAWASAALLYQYDCRSALKYVNGTTQVSDAMAFLLVLGNETSNAVAMLAALQRYGADTARWGPP